MEYICCVRRPEKEYTYEDDTLPPQVYQIKTPSVKKGKTPSSTVQDSNLPLGIKLTGGDKLRKDGLTGKGVRVAIIDSGIDSSHPGFEGQVKKQVWFRGGTPLSQDNHGTHVAGTVHLMAPEAELYDYRVFGRDGGVEVDEAIALSIYEACYDGCNVINMSLGGRYPSSAIRTAIVYAHSQGVIVVCAAGNEGDNNPLTNERSFPALWPECISVAAVSKQEDLPVAVFSNSNPHVDYAGIGVNVTSFRPGGGFFTISGTSMACPHVCGLITALMTKKDGGGVSYRRDICDDSSLRQLLNKKFLIDIGVEGFDNSTGLGFLTYLSKSEYEDIWSEMVKPPLPLS